MSTSCRSVFDKVIHFGVRPLARKTILESLDGFPKKQSNPRPRRQRYRFSMTNSNAVVPLVCALFCLTPTRLYLFQQRTDQCFTLEEAAQ